MTNLQEITDTLTATIVSDNLNDITTDLGEVILDEGLAEGVMKELPWFSLIFKTYKIGLAIRERLFTKKLLKFLLTIKDVNASERISFLKNLEDHSGEKAGEIILMLLDRFDSLNKPQIMGELVKAKIKENLTIERFLRLCSVVDRAYILDLKSLHRYKHTKFNDDGVADSLTSLGLIQIAGIDGGGVEEGSGGIQYVITQLGSDLLQYGLKN